MGVGSSLMSLAGDLTGGFLGSASARAQAEEQRTALDQAKATQLGYYQQAQGYQQPYQDAGKSGLQSQQDMINSGEMTHPFGKSFSDYYGSQQYAGPGQAPAAYQDKGFNFQADPGAQYRQDQALKAVQASAASRGMLHNTGTMNQIQKNASDLASQEYGNAFNRYANQRDFGQNAAQTAMQNYQNQRDFGRNVYTQDKTFGYNQYRNELGDYMTNLQNKYNRFGGLAQQGQYAANQGSQLASNMGNTMGGYDVDRGNVNAASQQAQYAAWMGAAQNGFKTMGGMMGGGGGGGGAGMAGAGAAGAAPGPAMAGGAGLMDLGSLAMMA